MSKENKEIEKEEIKIEGSENSDTETFTNSIEDDFEKMEKSTAEFSPTEDGNLDDAEPTENSDVKKDFKLTDADKFKIRLFLGFALYLIAGINVIILNFINGSKVPAKELNFDDDEKDDLMPYLENEKVMEWINKIPVEVLAIVHIEYMMIMKFNALAPKYKIGVKEEKENKDNVENLAKDLTDKKEDKND